jgi:hypothetical protein
MTTNAQLTLIETPRSWTLDEHTREVGRAGIARARAALAAGLRPVPAPSGSPPGAPADGAPTDADAAGSPGRGRPARRAA